MNRESGRIKLGQGKFLRLEAIQWLDRQGKERSWEVASRLVSTPSVLMIAWLRPSDRLLLIRQYRPPAQGYVIEFPAGIVEEGETPPQAVERELLEETGYRGRIVRVLPAAFNTPGLSSETVHPALVEIDERAPENIGAVQRLDDGEEIEIVRVQADELKHWVAAETDRGGRFDSKVLAYLAGLGAQR